jgi:two-component system, response regulator PdtaR
MAQASPQTRRALIVEDEILIALGLEAEMNALGFDLCELAPNDREARTVAMTAHPDIVLMDVNLDGSREGIESARWLREVCGTPVVFVTSYTDEGTLERIHEQVPGAPVLSKPVYGRRLADAVSAATQQQAAGIGT